MMLDNYRSHVKFPKSKSLHVFSFHLKIILGKKIFRRSFSFVCGHETA
jgi:hypothetical protein